MFKEKWLLAATLFVALGASGMGCELISNVDRSKIEPSGAGGTAGQGGTGGTTSTPSPGGGGTGGNAGTGGVGGTGGTGGSGGMPCVPVDDNNECTDDVCEPDGSTSHNPTPAGSPCVTGGSMCNGEGICVECLAPDDCPGEDNVCQTRTCDKGLCGFDFAIAGTPLPVQTEGDCKHAVCDGSGMATDEIDDADLPDDKNPCTEDVCTAGDPTNPPLPLDTDCGTAANGDPLVCDDMGTCVGCNTPDDCPGVDDECQARTCIQGACGIDFTAADTPVAAQTAGDCLKQVCDGAGNVVASADDADVPPDDGNFCTDDTCGAGAPIHPAKMNGSSCTDGSACTTPDTCQAGVCTPGAPVVCTALDQCHNAGTCNPATGVCSNPLKPAGAACNDGNGCTQVDVCNAVGTCVGSVPVTCTALNQCHNAGTCDPATGMCSNPNKPNGTACNDTDLCTTGDSCQAGTCTGNTVTCTALDQCHNAGTCNPATGMCSNPNKPNGTACNDSDLCTTGDSCQAGTCTGNTVTCTALDQCHDAGTCNPATGACSNPAKADGASCSDGNACTQTDTCQSGSCSGGNPVVCMALDECHLVGACNTSTGACSNPMQVDGTACTSGGVAGACANGVCGSCGDGNQTAGELCDDGNFINGDGCDNNCTPSACGNGITAGAELCDDGNLVNGDGCDNNCTLTGCGNGIPTGTEACDDGNLVNGDGCDNNCTATACGNGITAGTEVCDDGNLVSGDGCDANCKPTGCGNGILTGTEVCDDGNLISGDGCDANCRPTGCGNGFVTAGETCDDGNLLGNDGCGTKCQTEVPYSCTGNPSVCTSTAEINCNDGKDNDGDGAIDCADTNCALGCNANVGACAAGQALLVYTATDTPLTIPDVNTTGVTSNITVGGFGLVKRVVMQTNITHTYTGDIDATLKSPGNVVTDVTSDNGLGGDNYTDTIFNTACATSITAGTAPFTACYKPEQAFTVYNNSQAKGVWSWKVADDATGDVGTVNTWRLALCVAQSTCGDIALDAGETCDDGNALGGDTCDPNCTAPACGNGYQGGVETCDDGNLVSGDGCDANCKITACGNSIITAGEGCDDSNATSGDGCSATCQAELGYTCNGAPSVCTYSCGDGVKAAPEGCDDGNTTPGDGCSAACVVEAGYVCTGTTPSVCMFACGNGTLNTGETCDDANTMSNDGCSATCQIELGYTCSGTPSLCSFTCGNGTTTGAEQCDDGNLTPGDGCTDLCQVEPFYQCTVTAPSVCSKQETKCNDGMDNDADGMVDAADADCTLPAYFPACGAGQSLVVYRALGVPKAIPDINATGITTQVVATLGGAINKTALFYNITHTYEGDIDMFLTPPGAAALDVCSDNGTSGDNFVNTVLDTTCATAVTAGTSPFTGCYKPETAFTALNGTSPLGVWLLKVADDATGDTGTLNNWSLALCTTP